MNQGHCYKLFTDQLLDYTDAAYFCSKHEHGVLAMPTTFTQAEFLESMVNLVKSESTLQENKIWLGHRREDLYDNTYFSIINGHGSANYASQTGDCIVMALDSSGSHKGWERLPCNSKMHFICQKSMHYLMFLKNIKNNISLSDESLSQTYLPYVRGPKVLLPLTESEPKSIFQELSIIEKNVGYDKLWAPSTLLGSPMFYDKLSHSSYIKVDLSKELKDLQMLSILFWARPTGSDMGVALVQKII